MYEAATTENHASQVTLRISSTRPTDTRRLVRDSSAFSAEILACAGFDWSASTRSTG